MNKRIYGQEKQDKGFSLVEILLAAALFALTISVFVGAIIYGLDTAVMAGQQARAVELAQEGLEAARNIRDGNFNNLRDGNFGLVVQNGVWVLAGGPDITGIFSRQITIAPVVNSTSTQDVTVTVTWPENLQRDGSVSLESWLTDWKGD